MDLETQELTFSSLLNKIEALKKHPKYDEMYQQLMELKELIERIEKGEYKIC